MNQSGSGKSQWQAAVKTATKLLKIDSLSKNLPLKKKSAP
jgi:hypothetical protein